MFFLMGSFSHQLLTISKRVFHPTQMIVLLWLIDLKNPDFIGTHNFFAAVFNRVAVIETAVGYKL